MPRRYELTDEQFAMIADLLPAAGRPGGQWNDHRTTLDGIFWALHTGARWRELPERYGRWKEVGGRGDVRGQAEAAGAGPAPPPPAAAGRRQGVQLLDRAPLPAAPG